MLPTNLFSYRRHWGPVPTYPRVVSYIPPHTGFTVIAGPCSVEDPAQILTLAEYVKACGATHLRGGVFRAGTYPGKSFGLIDEKLLESYFVAAELNGLQNIIEILDYSEPNFSRALKYCHCVQVGARQMQNYVLLRKLGACGKPVFLKRHPGTTLDEWLGAAEHILTSGCKELYLIERGSVSHVNHVRWDLSLSMIPAVQEICQVPIIVDGSHGTGRRDLVARMTLAGVAAGANGLLCEVHQNPEKSLSDADQAIQPSDFRKLMEKVWFIREVVK